MRWHDVTFVLVEREVRTLVRSRTVLAVASAFFLVIVGIGGAAMGSPGGYVSLAYNLLLPVEVLAPTMAFAFVYQSVRGDDERGELDIIRTYPVSRLQYVSGTFAGRTLVLLVVLFVSLGAAGLVSSFGTTPSSSFFATHSAGDTIVVYARFVFFAGVYAIAASALALAVSAITRTKQESLTAAVGLLVALAVGFDLLVLGSLSAGAIQPQFLGLFVGMSPASAFRGLVLAVAIRPALASEPAVRMASPLTSAVSLVAWSVIGVGSSAVAVWQVN